MYQVVYIQTIEDEDDHIYFILDIVEQIKRSPKKQIAFNFKNCRRIGCVGTAALGAVANYVEKLQIDKIEKQKRELNNIFPNDNRTISIINSVINSMLYKFENESYWVRFDVDSMSHHVLTYLKKNNFLGHFQTEDGKKIYNNKRYIGFHIYPRDINEEQILDDLNNWLHSDKIQISEKLKETILSKLYELYYNAYEHGILRMALPIGVISCASFDNETKILTLVILDMGNGIAYNVRNHLQDQNLSDVDAIKWALQKGNSTKTDTPQDMPRGLGFALLKEFVTLNRGGFDIYSNSGHAYVDLSSGDYKIQKMNLDFTGTLVKVEILCDDKFYKFKNEDVYF